jgi:hypothetical protein
MVTKNESNLSPRPSSHDLYKLPDGTYKVASFKLKTPHVLPSVEGACEVLEMLGVPDQEIDYALIDMAQKDSNHAQFGVLHGAFIFSEKVEMNK